MPLAGSLKDIYIEEMRDLWSANDQMQRIMHSMSQKAADKKLKDLLDRSVEGIAKHSETLRSVLESQGRWPRAMSAAKGTRSCAPPACWTASLDNPLRSAQSAPAGVKHNDI